MSESFEDIPTQTSPVVSTGPVVARDSAADEDAAPVPPSIDGFTQFEPITTRANMGEVWKAFQLGVDRTVAIKILRADRLLRSNSRIRFEREVKLASRLKHPHIAQIYASGLHRQKYYYVMEFIKGTTLDVAVRQAGFDQYDIARMMEKVCRAVQYAHEQGVIHRDLKPANVMVDAELEPRILDFGLAKPADEADELGATLSIEGEIMGTVPYMAPEQTVGAAVDERTDIYALGIMLFQLLTGQVPFRGTIHAMMSQIVTKDPPMLRELDQKVHPDLEAVVLKAIAKDPGRRYATADDLADELARFCQGEAVKAARRTLISQVKRWCSNPKRIRDAGYFTVSMAVIFSTLNLWGVISNLLILITDFSPPPHITEPPNHYWFALILFTQIILIFFPMIYLGIRVAKAHFNALVIGLVFYFLVMVYSNLVIARPSLYPFNDFNPSDAFTTVVWTVVFVCCAVATFLHVAAIFAFHRNRRIIAWSKT